MNNMASIKAFISNHYTKILTGLGCLGMLGSTVLAVSQTPKAIQLIEAKKEELEKDKLTPWETIKATWKCYIWSAAAYLASAGCIIGSDVGQAQRIAGLSSAYLLSEDLIREYRNKVAETIGEEKEKAIEEEARKNTIKEQVERNSDLFGQYRNDEDFPCYDKYSKKIFWSTKEKIAAKINKLNYEMMSTLDSSINLNDYWYTLDIEGGDPIVGNALGWRIDTPGADLLQVRCTPWLLNDENHNEYPVMMIEMDRDPERNYDR